jgi:putative salt-induced outer membrane protein
MKLQPGSRNILSILKERVSMSRFSVMLMVSAAGLFPLSLPADQIFLKNGDRLTGSIEHADAKNVVIKTDLAGEVTLPWSAVRQLTTSQPLHVETKQGATLVGEVTTSDGSLQLRTKDQGPVTVSRDAVTHVRNAAEEKAYQESLHPGLLHNWHINTTVGFALTAGNSETKNLALALAGGRKTLHDGLSLYANSVYATNDAPGAVPSVTANSDQGGARYDRNLARRLFGFGAADFQADALQDLNLRSVFTAGLGFHGIHSDRTTLDLLSGINYTRENYSTFSRDLSGATLGEEFMKKLGAGVVLTEKQYFYPDLTETGEYRATFNLGIAIKINQWLGWQQAFGDIYVTNPPVDKKRNDILLTTGLNVSFIH